MSRNYCADDYQLQEQHERERRYEIEAEQEPAWMHYRLCHPPARHRRYFSGLHFRPAA